MSVLQLEVHDRIGWLTLNRPQVCNAIDQSMLQALDQALAQVERREPELNCLVLQGAGKHFCGGIDLRSMQSPCDQQHMQPLMKRSFLDHAIERLLLLRVPVVVAVQGVAAGAGMTLALTGDVIVMADDACFAPSFTRLGLVPDCGITHLLAERIGWSRARAILMLGNRIDARKAVEWGLAYESVPAELLQLKTKEYASQLAAGPQAVLGATRSVFHQPGPRSFRKQLEIERIAHDQALLDREYVEGFAAFFEHRNPRF